MKNATLKLKLSLLFISILISLSLAFSSCNDSLDDETTPNQKVTLKGTIALSGALPSELVSGFLEADSPSRAAFPTTTGCTYSVTAVCTNPAESVNGTISGNSYSIELTLGRTYTVTAALKNGDSDIFSDDWENVEVTRGNAATLSHDFILKGKSGGSGSIELNITVPSSVKSVKASSSSSGWDSSSPSFTLDSTTATLSCSSINAGTYEVTLDFYDSTDESNRILLYSCTQSINVVENMKTNLWKESSSASSPISNDTFTLTDELITSFERTQIYVGDTSVGTASESGSGSPYAPLATFEKALSIIENQGASNKDYTIWISGNFTGTKTLSSSLDGKAQSITISGTNGNSTDVLDGNNGGTTLTVSTSVPVTIKNLKITGGSAENGGGINNSGTLSLSDGCLVSGNTASNYGGGVYSTGTMFMYGSAVIGDSTKNESATESGYSNKAGCGGGIYSTGNLYLGYSESNTKTELTGGVFYNFSANTGGIYQYGPGEESSSNLKLDSGFVSYNAERGIYAGKCTFTMTGGTINGNKAFDDTSNAEIRGAGFYAGTTCTALISGGTISSNMAAGNGGGIYIAQDNSYVTLKGGTISSNTAGDNGNGIALMKGALKMQGGVKVDSGNDVYLASGKVITVTGELTGTTPVATITPAAWSRRTTVVQADGTNLTTLKEDGEYDYTNYFAISDEDWNTKLSTDNKSLMIDAPIYVAGAGDDTKGTGTKSKPFATIAKACTEMKDKNTEFTIYIDGEVTGTQTISGNLNAKSVTLSGATGNTSDILNGNSQGTTLTVATAIPVTIKNLKITGGSATYGGGIYLGSDSNVTLSESIVTKNKSTGYGGGIAVYCASLIIDKSTITENRTTTQDMGVGAGIALAGNDTVTAKVTMKAGSVISGNKTYANKNGGGVALYIGKTQFTMEDGEISGNTAYAGGGVYMCNNAEFILKDGKISGNTATHSSGTVGGGGIYLCNQASLLMSGGEISGNVAKDYGGGVAFADNETTQSFTMTGGVIKNNTLTSTSGLGKGIFVNGTFKMSGDALVDSTNDVYLASGKVITVTGELTGTSPVATITPAAWSRGTSIVQTGGTITNLTNYKYSFVLTDSDWNTKPSTDNKSLMIDAQIYVAGSENHPFCGFAGDDTGTGTKSKPYATIAKAIELLTDMNTDYTIYIDGTISGAQTIPSTLTNTTSGTYKAASLTIEGVNGLDSSTQEPKDILDGNSSGSTLTVESNVPVTITNLKITKGNGTGNSSKYGGGIYISDRASLALGNGALVTQNTASYGGGIYNRGKLFLYGTAMVGMQTNSVATSNNCGNKATEGGAGIYVNAEGQIYLGYRNESKPEELTGGVCGNYNAGIIDEYNQDYLGGGGIHLEGSTDTAKIEIASGNISYNYAVNGAGIFATGNVTMTGGTIKGNEGNSDDTENGKGGGLYLSTYSIGSYRTFTMSGSAVIENNKNIAFGAGVYLRNSNCTFEMKGGEIIDNIALSNGGAVYLNDDSSFNIQGEANIPYGGEANKNDIYMRHTTIRITDPLSERDAGKVIGLTPSSYTEGKILLKAEDDSDVILANEVGKFIVTNNEWGILATGSLVNAKTATTLAATLSALSANTVDNPYEILLYASSESDFETIKSILKSNSSKYVNITLYCPGFSSLPESAFSSCTSLVGITLPYGITAIGQYVFAGCSNLSSLILPESLKSTSYRDLNGCTALKSIVLPDSLETIGIQSFDSTGLTSITIPKNVKTIGDDAFASSLSLGEVIVDSENQYFKAIDGVLYNKEGTTLLYYPAAKTGSFAIPNSVTQIGGYSFYHSKLSNLTIPESVTSIGDRAFEACSLTSITLPNSLKTIDSEAFALCSNLTTVTIPKSVTSIYRSPFSGCSNLTEINVEEGNSKYVSVDGVLFDIDRTLLICYPAGSSVTSYTIPNTVKTIGTYAFNRCSKLTSITISDSVEYIRSYGIYSCTSLTSIIFTDTTTWYKTSNYTYTDGEVVDFTDSATNVTTIRNNYDKYWYKE